MVLAKTWRMKKTLLPGPPTKDNFELTSEELGQPKEGEIITKALFISVDPYLRGPMSRLPIGSPIPAGQVAEVIASEDTDFPVGCMVLGLGGWSNYNKFNPKKDSLVTSKEGLKQGVKRTVDIGSLSPSLLLGVCGMPGVTAYWGVLDMCKVYALKYIVFPKCN